MFKKVLLILLMFCSLSAAEVKVVFPYFTPPYVLGEGRGLEIDIVREALGYKSHTVKPIFISVGRSLEMFKSGFVDAIPIVQKNSGPGAYYSEPFIKQHVAAFALNSKAYDIEKIQDLKNYNVIAFQNAKKYLSKEFSDVAKASYYSYLEVEDQRQQVYMLLKNRTNVIVLDKYVFEYYKNELISQKKVDKEVKVDVFDLFKPTQYKLAFQDKSVRDDFDEGLRQLKKSGRYKEIYDYYAKEYFRMKI